MNIETSLNGAQARIAIEGIVDEQGADALKKQIGRLDFNVVREVIIDCHGIRHIGSSGIGKILLAYKQLASRGGSLAVINLPPAMYELFVELKLNTLFSVSQAV